MEDVKLELDMSEVHRAGAERDLEALRAERAKRASVGAMARRLGLVLGLVAGAWCVLLGAIGLVLAAVRVAVSLVGAVLP